MRLILLHSRCARDCKLCTWSFSCSFSLSTRGDLTEDNMETENAAAAAAAAFTASSQLKEAVLGRKRYWLGNWIRWEVCLLLVVRT